MRIIAFAEHYPSPYKSYHDTQFERFVTDGHDLAIFAFGRHEGELNPAIVKLGIDRKVTFMPATLKDLPRAVLPAAGNFFRSPILVTRRAITAARRATSAKSALMNAVRAAMLPTQEPDVSIVHSLRAQVHLGFLPHVFSSPIGFYYHGGEVPGVPTVAPPEAKAAFDTAHAVFTNTESSKRDAISRGCAPEKACVSPVGFNLADYPLCTSRTYRREGKLNLLSVGRMSAEKGIIDAIEGLAALLRDGPKDIVYRIVGDGPEAPALHAAVKKHGLESTVQFLGKVSRERLHEEYCKADVLLLPSVQRGTWVENQACVVQEAMLCSAVVAISRTGGVPESTAPHMHRFIFEPEQPEQIAATLRELLKLDAGELAAMGAGGREFAERKYDIGTLNRQILGELEARRARQPA